MDQLRRRCRWRWSAAGTTEYATFGINHTGTRVNWGAGTATASDGVWFAVDGEGGVNTDYLAYVGRSTGTPTLLTLATGGFSPGRRIDH